MWKTIISMGMALGLALPVSIALPTSAAQAAQDCGGLNQKTCISLNRDKRCKKGLVEKRQSGRNICVRPSSPRPKPQPAKDCGGLNQKTCVSLSRDKRCDRGLVEQRQSGRNICVRPSQVQPSRCGGLNQPTCISPIPSRRCKDGLAEQRRSGRNICVPASQVRPKERNCGGLNQPTCINVIPSRRCNEGLAEQRRSGRNICVPASQVRPKERNCGGLNQKTCINVIPARRCNAGLVEQRLSGRNICVRPEDQVEKDETCGGLGQVTCISVNPAKWCDDGLVQKRQRGRNICIKGVTNADRIDVAKVVIEDLGSNNPLANLARCLGSPSKLGALRDAMGDRSRNAISTLLTECDASISELANMGTLPALNGGAGTGVATRGASGNPTGFFKTLHITVGGSGAAWVAGTASAGYVIELVSRPNGRWYFTGGLGTGPKAEVVGDVTVSLSRADIPTGGFATDHGTSAVVSGHYGVGLSGGLSFMENTLNFDGVSFGVGGGLGAGGAVYKNGSIYPFPDM